MQITYWVITFLLNLYSVEKNLKYHAFMLLYM